MPHIVTLSPLHAMPKNGSTSAEDAVESARVEAAREGDQDAFAMLVEKHQSRVFRLAGRFFLRPEDVDDAAQDTFFLAWSKLASYRAEAPFEHWLTRLCLNLCYQKLRRKRVDEVELEILGHRLADRVRDPTAGIEVARLLLRLDPRDRFVLLLLDGEGWTTHEIADRLGWTRTNVKVRAHRARQRLRKLIEKDVRR